MAIALNEEQKQTVRQWVKEGCGLSEIQKRITKDFQIPMTYMDVRFLIIDLGLQLQERPSRPAVAVPAVDAASKPRGPGGDAEWEEDDGAGVGPAGSAVSVQVDRVTKPGTLVSGTVTFSDGVSATWSLDQLGRLMLGATKPGYRPSEVDVQAFQVELRAALEKRGF